MKKPKYNVGDYLAIARHDETLYVADVKAIKIETVMDLEWVTYYQLSNGNYYSEDHIICRMVPEVAK